MINLIASNVHIASLDSACICAVQLRKPLRDRNHQVPTLEPVAIYAVPETASGSERSLKSGSVTSQVWQISFQVPLF